MHFLFNFIVLIDEWKKQLSVHFIDYNLLDVRETIASGFHYSYNVGNNFCGIQIFMDFMGFLYMAIKLATYK